MLALGIVLTIFGIIMALIGNGMNNNMDMQFESFFESGQVNPGDVFIYLGIGLVVLGIIFVIIGIAGRAQKNNIPPWAAYGSTAGTQMFKCCRCGYKGLYSRSCPVCKSKQTMLPYNGNTVSSGHSEGQSGVSAVKCHSCGSTIASGSKFCSKCGSAVVNGENDGHKCAKCGAAVKDGAAFCANCGNKL